MITFILVLIDQFIKYSITAHYTVGATSVIIPKTLSLTYVENEGAAFSLFSGNITLIIAVSIILLFVLYKYILVSEKYSSLRPLIFAGIVSNLIDRLFRGCVIDYLDFNIGGYNAPIFNLADIFIVVGSIIFILKAVEEK